MKKSHVKFLSWPGCFAARHSKVVAWLVCGFSVAVWTEVLASEPTNEWVFPLGATSDATLAIAPDGTLYLGTFDGRFWAVNPDGTRKWRYRAGGEIRSSPAIAADRTIYFGSRDRKLYALSSEGVKNWEFKTGWWVDSSPAIGSDGTIYVGSWDKNFYAVSPDGSEKWRFKTDGPVVSSAAIGTNGVIHFGSHDGRFYALAPGGSKLWEFKTGGPIVSSPALDWDGGIFFTSVDGFLYALNGDGRLRWKVRTGSFGEGSPVVGLNGFIVIAATDELWVVTPDGKRKWARGKEDIDSTPAVTADGAVIFVYRNGLINVCDHDAGFRWAHNVYPIGYGSPAIGASGTIYLPGMWNGLVAIRANGPLAATPWPKFRGNPRNTGNLSDCRWQ